MIPNQLSGASLGMKILQLAEQDQSSEIKAQEGKLDSIAKDRDSIERYADDMREKAEKLSAKAEKLSKEAEDCNFFESLFGEQSSLEESAYEYDHAASMSKAKMDEAQIAAEQASSKAQDALEKMQATLDQMKSSRSDLETMQQQNDRILRGIIK